MLIWNPIADSFWGATRSDDDPPSTDWVTEMPWLTLVLAAGVGIAPLFSSSEPSRPSVTFGFLLALVASMMVWYIRAFTFAIDEQTHPASVKIYRRQIFVFAYAFTFISFVVVALPSRELLRFDAGSTSMSPITLVYGCFHPEIAPGTKPPLLCDQALIDRVDGKAGVAAKGGGDRRDYPVLLALGGQVGNLEPGVDNAPDIHVIRGGLVLPLYVVLVAMIGGAISLSRRIPEIQKRADPTFPGTTQQSRLQLFEAREQVIFQIMQLVSAPFIAICSFHILDPKGTASAVALAFGSGFASETILLMIRSVVEGIRPGIAHNVATELSALSGVVVDAAGKPVVGAAVRLQRDADAGGQPSVVSSGGDGKFLFNAVPRRTHVVRAEKDGMMGQALADVTASSASVTIKLVENVVPGPAPAPAQAPATLTGRVLDLSGIPIALASVWTDDPAKTIVTDAAGSFTLTVAAGAVVVHARTANPVREGSATATATDGASVSIDVVVS